MQGQIQGQGEGLVAPPPQVRGVTPYGSWVSLAGAEGALRT